MGFFALLVICFSGPAPWRYGDIFGQVLDPSIDREIRQRRSGVDVQKPQSEKQIRETLDSQTSHAPVYTPRAGALERN